MVKVMPIRLHAHALNARMMAEHGIQLARNAPTLSALRDEYGIPGWVRRWADMADVLIDLHNATCDALTTGEGIVEQSREGTPAHTLTLALGFAR